MSLDLIPMLLLSLLLLTSGGTGAETVSLALNGEQRITQQDGALIVADADVTIPAGAQIAGPIHVIGGSIRIQGTVLGGVTQIAGTVVVDEQATIAGTLHHIGGALTVAPTAAVQSRAELVPVEPSDRHPVLRHLPAVLLTAVLAMVGARRAGRTLGLLAVTGRAVTGHPLVSVTVGALVMVTFLSLFVFMGFTVVLLPVALLGLAGGLLMLAYGVVVLGFLVGRRTPWRPAPATAAGIVVVMLALQLLGRLPVVGDILLGGVLLGALGAVFLTYFGLQEFRPVPLPE